jgi:hypothetical protein
MHKWCEHASTKTRVEGMRTCWQNLEAYGTVLYRETMRGVESEGGAVYQTFESSARRRGVR